jgi:hypothetical protein
MREGTIIHPKHGAGCLIRLAALGTFSPEGEKEGSEP